MKAVRPKPVSSARKESSAAHKAAVAARPAPKPVAPRTQPNNGQPAAVVAQPAAAQPAAAQQPPTQPPLPPGVPIMPFPRPTILGLGSPWRTAGRPAGMPPRPAPAPHPAPAPQPRPAAIPVVTMRFPMSAVEKLIKEKRMQDAGLTAFAARKENRSGIYSYEQRSAELVEPYQAKFKRNKLAWKYFQSQPAWYRKLANWWVVSAKREETRLKRLDELIADSAQGRTIRQILRKK